MRNYLGLLGGAAVSVILTSDVDRKCTAAYTRTVSPFTLGIRYPPTCAATAARIADTLEGGLRALMVRWPWLLNREIYIDIPMALDPLPPTCRYLGRSRSRNKLGVLALLTRRRPS